MNDVETRTNDYAMRLLRIIDYCNRLDTPNPLTIIDLATGKVCQCGGSHPMPDERLQMPRDEGGG